MSEEASPAVAADAPQQNASGKWKPFALLGIVVFLMFLAWYFKLGAQLGRLQTWIDGLGPLGPIVFILIYVVATVTALPGSALTLIGGAIFGPLVGTICVSIGSTLGACLCFLIARYFARDSMEQWLSKNEKFAKLDRMTERQGAIAVALTRVVPIFPFNLLNYGFGLTKVPFWTYAICSWLFMLPGTIVYVAGGSVVGEGAKGEFPTASIVAMAVALVVMVVMVRKARKQLADREPETAA